VNHVLNQVYKVVFGFGPEIGIEDWQIAEKLLDHFDVPRLGEKLAKECIYQIVNHICYPDQETGMRIVSRAEGLASELWDNLSDEPHMAEIERLEFLEYWTKNKK